MQIQSSTSTTLVQPDTGQNRPAPVSEESAKVNASIKVSSDAVQANKPIPSSLEVNEALKKLNDNPAVANQGLLFSVDESTKKNIVKIVDSKSNEVIRQIPTTEALEIAKAIDRFQGLLIKDKV